MAFRVGGCLYPAGYRSIAYPLYSSPHGGIWKTLPSDYPYCVFGLKKSSSDEDMKSAYRKSVLKAHPDRGGSNELFRKVRGAWEYFTEYCKS